MQQSMHLSDFSFLCACMQLFVQAMIGENNCKYTNAKVFIVLFARTYPVNGDSVLLVAEIFQSTNSEANSTDIHIVGCLGVKIKPPRGENIQVIRCLI